MTRQALSEDDVRGLRMRAQLLAGPPARDVVTAVTQVGALQAQSAAPTRLAVRARTAGLRATDVDKACAGKPTVVRTWAMRGTIHMVPAVDATWMVALLGPVFIKANRRRREQLHLDDATCERALHAIETVLKGAGPLTRAELIERIDGEGVHIDPKTQAPAHLVAYAAMRGLICRGPDLQRDEPSYVLFAGWVNGGRAKQPDEALSELARRYLAGHGPAAAPDFAAWSGLPAGEAKKAFELVADETEEVDAAGKKAAVLAKTDLEHVAQAPPRLLGHWDAYLLGYQSRDLVLDAEHGKKIQAGGGYIQPAVVVDGRVVGTWQLQRARKLKVTVEPFTTLPRGSSEGLRAEADDVGRFLGDQVTLSVAK